MRRQPPHALPAETRFVLGPARAAPGPAARGASAPGAPPGGRPARPGDLPGSGRLPAGLPGGAGSGAAGGGPRQAPGRRPGAAGPAPTDPGRPPDRPQRRPCGALKRRLSLALATACGLWLLAPAALPRGTCGAGFGGLPTGAGRSSGAQVAAGAGPGASGWDARGALAAPPGPVIRAGPDPAAGSGTGGPVTVDPAPTDPPAGPRARAAARLRLACPELRWAAELAPLPGAAADLGGLAAPQGAPVPGPWPLAKLYRLELEARLAPGTWIGVALVAPALRGDPGARRFVAEGLVGPDFARLEFSLPETVPWGSSLDLEVWSWGPGAAAIGLCRQRVEVLEAWSWDLGAASPGELRRLRLSGLAPQARYQARLELLPLDAAEAGGAPPAPLDPGSATGFGPPSVPGAGIGPGLAPAPLGGSRPLTDRGSGALPELHPWGPQVHLSARAAPRGSAAAAPGQRGLTAPPAGPAAHSGSPALELLTNPAGQVWLPGVAPGCGAPVRLVVWLRPMAPEP